MDKYMQSSNLDYKDEKKEDNQNIKKEDDYSETFANIQASLEEQEKMEKKMKKAQKVPFWSEDPNVLLSKNIFLSSFQSRL